MKRTGLGKTQTLRDLHQRQIVPAQILNRGVAPQIAAFDPRQVTEGLFHVRYAEGKKPPPCAHVAVCYKGYWFYIDERDRDTKATFSLLVELSRLQLSTDKGGPAPVLTLPVGGR